MQINLASYKNNLFNREQLPDCETNLALRVQSNFPDFRYTLSKRVPCV